MSRMHSDRTDDAPNLSGSLKDELRRHAFERCRHFFLYVFHVKALTDHVNANHGLGLGPTDAVYIHATHQIDTGLRSTDVEYFGFDGKDANIVDQSATGCGRTDAAHFCNLGIDAKCHSMFGGLAGKDKIVARLFETLKLVCGNTRQLPQRVNIGPDKIIDAFHGDLATAILKGGIVPVSKTTLKLYIDGADKVMKEYEDKHTLSGNHGIAACTRAYRACYAADFNSIWQTISDNVTEECRVIGANKDNYVAWL